MKIKTSKENILLWALSSTILIDFINGSFRGGHIGEIVRTVLLIYCGSIIFSSSKKEVYKFTSILIFLFINIAFSLLHDSAKGSFRTDLSMGLKTIIFYTISSSVLILYRKGKFQKETIDKIININLIYTPILFALSRFTGGGNAGYDWIGEAVGTKSEFLSLNSINSAMMFIYMYCVYHIFSKKKKIWAFGAIYIAIPMLMLGTKTSILIVVAIPVFFALLRIKKRSTVKKVIIITVILAIVLPIMWPYIMNKMSGILARQTYLFRNRSFWSYLTSTRSDRVAVVWDHYVKHFNLLDIFPGKGYHYTHHIVSRLMGYTSDVIPIEMDWMDILTAYGVWGFMYTYIYAIKPLVRSRKTQRTDDQKMFFWITVIMIVYGTFAGHVFTEAISSTFLAIGFCGYNMSVKEAEIDKNSGLKKSPTNMLRGYKGRQYHYE